MVAASAFVVSCMQDMIQHGRSRSVILVIINQETIKLILVTNVIIRTIVIIIHISSCVIIHEMAVTPSFSSTALHRFNIWLSML